MWSVGTKILTPSLNKSRETCARAWGWVEISKSDCDTQQPLWCFHIERTCWRRVVLTRSSRSPSERIVVHNVQFSEKVVCFALCGDWVRLKVLTSFITASQPASFCFDSSAPFFFSCDFTIPDIFEGRKPQRKSLQSQFSSFYFSWACSCVK